MTGVCDACRDIDFGKALVPGAWSKPDDNVPPRVDGSFGMRLDENADRFANDPNPDCSVCQILNLTLCPCEREWSSHPGYEMEAAKEPYTLRALSFQQNCRWTSTDVPGVADCTILLSTRGLVSPSGDYSRFIVDRTGYVVCLPKDREPRVFVPQVIPDTLDFTKAKLWLEHCHRSHGSVCNQTCEPLDGMKVIDCETLSIVPAQPNIAWIALSYVWGPSQPDISTIASNQLPERLPATVEDAIQVTKCLGYRYLWIDRYCIDQEDKEGKQHQIARMDAIYQGADLTIVSAAGTDENFGLPGVGATKRAKQPIVELDGCTILGTGPNPTWATAQSRWASRGWTFQESLLSRQRLIFTEHQAYFECGKGGWMEALGGLELIQEPEDEAMHRQWASQSIGRTFQHWLLQPLKYHKPIPDSEVSEALQRISLLMSMYTRRNLTYDEDAMDAFSGVASRLRQPDPLWEVQPVMHLFGIPYMVSQIYQDAAETYFTYFLCWFHGIRDDDAGNATPRRRPHFPSWSWAGWHGEAKWMHSFIAYEGVQATTCFLRNMRIEENGEDHDLARFLCRITSEAERSKAAANPRPEGGIAIRFEARLVPRSMFSQYGDSDDDDDNDEDDGDDNDSSAAVGSETSGDLPVHTEQPDDLDDGDYQPWYPWRVGEHFLVEKAHPPCTDFYHLVEKIEAGEWLCLVLCEYNGNGGFSHRRFLLVVESLPDGVSFRRVGSLVLHDDPYLHEPPFFECEGLEWKEIRLV